MSHTRPVVVQRPAVRIVGLSITTTLQASRLRGTVTQLINTMRERRTEVAHAHGNGLLLVQIYPRHRRFDVDVPFRAIVGIQVQQIERLPPDMISHIIPGGDFAMVTHHGPHTDIGRTYHAIYRYGLRQLERWSAGFDVEVLGDQLPNADTQPPVDIYVALQRRAPTRRSFMADEDGIW